MNNLLFILLLFLNSSFYNPQEQTGEYDKWLNFYNLNDKHFDTEEDIEYLNLVWNKCTNCNENHRHQFKHFYIFSSDSTYFLDLDSYSLSIENSNGKLVSYGFGNDTKIELVNHFDGLSTEILFCGSMCIIETAEWLTNETIYLLGFINQDEVFFNPVRWKINIEDQSISISIANIKINGVCKRLP